MLNGSVGGPDSRLFLPIFSRQVTPLRRVLQQTTQRLRENAADCRMGMGEAWVRTKDILELASAASS